MGNTRVTRPTWKAEEAVPNTKPFGKLPLVIFSDKHIWIIQTTTSITKAMPLLLSIIACSMDMLIRCEKLRKKEKFSVLRTETILDS